MGREKILRTTLASIFSLALLINATSPAFAIDGMINVHDPSTVIECDGQYYVFGTGRGIPILNSKDMFTWSRMGRVFDRIPDSIKSLVPKNNGIDVWAPDIIKSTNGYNLYYAVSSWDSFVSAIGLMTNPTLNPTNPKYKWTDCGMVVKSDGGKDLNAIDPGVVQHPDGTMWLCYGSYHGNIELVELDPKTGRRISPKSPVSIISSHSEAADIIFHDNFFYLFVNHGTCCRGKNSTYNIRVGRSAKVTGPYLDRHDNDLAKGAGTLFLAAAGTQIGPGHFGRIIEDSIEKFSCHYEADTSRTGRSVLDIRPLLWTADGWPEPGQNLTAGTYKIQSQQTGTFLQLPKPATPDGAAPRIENYLSLDHQKWTISPAAGGFYKITSAETPRVLEVGSAATTQKVSPNLEIAPASNADNQLWKIDQLTDRSYRIKSKANNLALTSSTHIDFPRDVELTEFKGDDHQRWVFSPP